MFAQSFPTRRLTLFTLCFFLFCIFLAPPRAKADINGNVDVSMMVPPRDSDFQFSFTANPQSEVNQNKTINYEITYGTKSSIGTTGITTIVADFSQDINAGIDILEYVPGSATN